MATTALNKLLDLGLAMVMFRALGDEGVGKYTWAVLVVGYFDILVNFGLGVLLTRDLARDWSGAGRYLGGALLLRTALWCASLGAAVVLATPLAGPIGITSDMGMALVALTIGIGVSNLAGLASALCSAREQMVGPSLVTVFTALLKALLGVGALTMGFGIVGLAVSSIVVNLATAAVLVLLLLRVVGPVRPRPELRFGLWMLTVSYPLMLNNLLATVFFRVDGLILRAVAGDAVLGWYSAAYRFIDGVSLIPSSLTLALFPLLSRLAAPARAGTKAPALGADGAAGTPESHLLWTTRLALELLLALALPLAVGTTLLAEPLVRLIAGASFLPHAAIALQVLIWFVPFSFANGLLQYVLISVDRQGIVTRSFALAVAFNLVGNLLLVPSWSYLGAGVITVLSEVVLLGPFWVAVERNVGRIALWRLAWRPAVAAAGMAPVVWLLADLPAIAVPLGAACYVALLIGLGGVSPAKRRLVRALLGR